MDRENVIKRLKKVSRYFKSMLKVGYDGDSDVYTEYRESVKMAIELLKEQKGLMLALEQSNAVNGFLNAEVERLNGLLKEQEDAYQGAEELLRQKTILFDDAIKRLKEQEAEIRQLRLALDIAK